VTTPVTPAAEATEEPEPTPLVVVSGEATVEEVAALTAVVAALGAAQTSTAGATPAPVSQWAARSRQLRGPHVAGPGGWRASMLPR
jgi:hypothetical protein